jgi:hypothetical protein
MKLSEHTEHIRKTIDQSFRNRLGRIGITQRVIPKSSLTAEQTRMIAIFSIFEKETGGVETAYEKLIEELTFTLFNRIAALKVMEAHILHPEIITRRETHGGRSFSHLAWLEENPKARSEEAEALPLFLEAQLQKMAGEFPLFSPDHPYHLLPTPLELSGIFYAFNQVEIDPDVVRNSPKEDESIWKSDDILGWLYESYNNYKKAAHKASKEKTEYNKVSIQSQVYTPRWVVQFLVDNSLGKLYLEMYPDSEIRNKYKIANPPKTQTRQRKPLHEIRLIDPATGSGNFLLYAFDVFYDLYLDQIENYGAEYDEKDIPKLILENNLHGVDLDDRAIQLAQLGLYIKAKRKKRTIKIEYFSIVSSDFFLPAYGEVKHLFETDAPLDKELELIVKDIWEDLQKAHKFGSLLRIEEKFTNQLQGLVSKGSGSLFGEQSVKKYDEFRKNFFTNLQKAVSQNTAKQGITFLNTKTQDAITYLQVLTQKYDIAVANPPYTDSSDFGTELKKFVEANYKQPYKFNSNLYASFIKRCFELTNQHGKQALIHPLTFMYIKTFEDVRKFILENLHISIFVDYGLSNLFGAVMVDPAFYVLEKNKNENEKSLFVSLDQYTRTPNEKYKKDFCLEALDNFIHNKPNKHNYTLPQEKLKIIEGYPFIYWISDAFREKFKEKPLEFFTKNSQGMSVSNGEKYTRFSWELASELISDDFAKDSRRWVKFVKGGPFNKWYGNNWLVVDWYNNGENLKNDPNAVLRNQMYYFQEGITYSSSGSKGSSFRYLPTNFLFSGGGPSITIKKEGSNILPYVLGFLNSNLNRYILDCLNPTVNTTQGDLNRVPFVSPIRNTLNLLTLIVKSNIEIKKNICSYHIIEPNFTQSPLTAFQGATLKDRVLSYLHYENSQLTQVLLHEAIINELVFEVYELSSADREQVEAKMGKSIGSLPVLQEARESYLSQIQDPVDEVVQHIKNLPTSKWEEPSIRTIKESFATLYQSNNDLEEFCITHQLNPINVWYWFREAGVVPKARSEEIALEFLADAIRSLLQEDKDGIIPLVGLPGEEALSQRLEEFSLRKGFTSAQFLQLDSLLGRSLPEYLEHHFFKNLCDHLNLFMYLPKTPFIWHLSSGTHQGFEAYTLIYKWNRDSLFKLKSLYISQRVQNLEYRLIQLQNTNTAQAQNEKEKIHLQLEEIKHFVKKIDELIAEGYNPILDDGVGKNIAPLQKKGLLRAEVLSTKGGTGSQLEKYLHADW